MFGNYDSDTIQERNPMKKIFVYLFKAFSLTVILLLTGFCYSTFQEYASSKAITVITAPESEQKHRLLYVEVQGGGSLYDGRSHHRNTTRRYALSLHRRKTFRLQPDTSRKLVRIQLNNVDITNAIQQGSILLNNLPVQHLIVQFSDGSS